MGQDRVIFHIDVNSAFLSWEAVHRLRCLGDTLDLRDIPSAVGGEQAAARCHPGEVDSGEEI